MQAMLRNISTTWFLASPGLLTERFRLRAARQVRDPFTRGPMTLIGPTFEADPREGLPFFEVEALEPDAVALLFGVDALEELDRTHAEGASELAARFENGLPALYRIPPAAVRAFAQSDVPRADRAAAFAERLRERDLEPGGRLATHFEERCGAWPQGELPDEGSEVVAAFAMLIGGAQGDEEVYGYADKL